MTRARKQKSRPARSEQNGTPAVPPRAQDPLEELATDLARSSVIIQSGISVYMHKYLSAAPSALAQLKGYERARQTLAHAAQALEAARYELWHVRQHVRTQLERGAEFYERAGNAIQAVLNDMHDHEPPSRSFPRWMLAAFMNTADAVAALRVLAQELRTEASKL
jgi:hypothetical protein